MFRSWLGRVGERRVFKRAAVIYLPKNKRPPPPPPPPQVSKNKRWQPTMEEAEKALADLRKLENIMYTGQPEPVAGLVAEDFAMQAPVEEVREGRERGLAAAGGCWLIRPAFFFAWRRVRGVLER